MSSPYSPSPGIADADSPSTPAAARPNGRFTLRRGALGGTRAAPRDEDVSVDATDDEDTVDWRAVGTFTAGVFLGALIGASTALLLAPASGFETRTRIVRGARRAGERVADRWDSAGDRVRQSARRSRKKLERKLTMARWRARDAWEAKRYGA